ncbi:MAG: TerB family tellurite resistance protein [Cytophagales bacterium]|nr:TerB family tellurite resistance protein [Cytophagales bacterium]
MFGFFKTDEKKEIKTHLRHLVRLAKADGVLHKDELKFIYRIGKQNGLTKKQVEKIIENPTAVDIVMPESRQDKFSQVFDLVQMMMKDGEVNDAETEFCMELANRLGFRKFLVGVLVAKIERGINEGLNREQIMKEAEPFINY